MLLGGLWHGANWTFVAWGCYHGLLLILDRVAERVTSRMPVALYRSLTFLFVVVGWVLFRSNDFHMAGAWLRLMAGMGASGSVNGPGMLWGLLGLCLLASNVIRPSWEFAFRPSRRLAAVVAVSLFAAYLFMNGTDSVFLYYQF
jgi:alginate O-acetyltransferase complex protein AlgI